MPNIKKNNVEDNLELNNSSENILQESGSFGNYQYSNLISKENIFQESINSYCAITLTMINSFGA